MAAPKGNRFWELRSKHGRDKIFSSPAILWEEACKYFEWCEDNPLIQIDFKGSNIIKVEIPKMRPFTWDGLELFLDIDSFREYKTNPEYKDFSQVIKKIEKTIYKQKFEGASAGLLNANIIARDLGLKDHSVSESTVETFERPKITFTPPVNE
jgi:hypothetical protein